MRRSFIEMANLQGDEGESRKRPMSECSVRVENLHKVFRVWRRPSDVFVETLTGRVRHTDFPALTDISFEVPSGSVFGVLGRNGAGKSTLLRIIAGTLDATRGSVQVNGRVAAILELGTGFHPEYTGRDNVYLGGLCLGLTRKEIDDRVDEIIAFAELEDFIDQPFRTYSSGMQARLTFAVATSVDPDVLIVDEALSVGDARFALKSFDRIRAFARSGKTILFVSHDINQVMTFCDRAMVLEKGQVYAIGDPREVGNSYHELLFRPADLAILKPTMAERAAPSAPEPAIESVAEGDAIQSPPPAAPRIQTETAAPVATAAGPSNDPEHRYGDGLARITEIFLRDEAGRRSTRLTSTRLYEVVMRIRASAPVRDVCIGLLVRTPWGVDVFGSDSLERGGVGTLASLEKGEEVLAVARFRNNLAPGRYFLTASLARKDAHKHDLRFDLLEISVEPADGVYASSIVNLEMDFEFQAVEGAAPQVAAR